MTLTVWLFADPCWAFAMHPDSSGRDVRESAVLALAVGLFQRCPKAMPGGQKQHQAQAFTPGRAVSFSAPGRLLLFLMYAP